MIMKQIRPVTKNKVCVETYEAARLHICFSVCGNSGFLKQIPSDYSPCILYAVMPALERYMQLYCI